MINFLDVSTDKLYIFEPEAEKEKDSRKNIHGNWKIPSSDKTAPTQKKTEKKSILCCKHDRIWWNIWYEKLRLSRCSETGLNNEEKIIQVPSGRYKNYSYFNVDDTEAGCFSFC